MQVYNLFHLPFSTGFDFVSTTPGPLTSKALHYVIPHVANGMSEGDLRIEALRDKESLTTFLCLVRLSALRSPGDARPGVRYAHVVIVDQAVAIDRKCLEDLFVAKYGSSMGKAIDDMLVASMGGTSTEFAPILKRYEFDSRDISGAVPVTQYLAGPPSSGSRKSDIGSVSPSSRGSVGRFPSTPPPSGRLAGKPPSLPPPSGTSAGKLNSVPPPPTVRGTGSHSPPAPASGRANRETNDSSSKKDSSDPSSSKDEPSANLRTELRIGIALLCANTVALVIVAVAMQSLRADVAAVSEGLRLIQRDAAVRGLPFRPPAGVPYGSASATPGSQSSASAAVVQVGPAESSASATVVPIGPTGIPSGGQAPGMPSPSGTTSAKAAVSASVPSGGSAKSKPPAASPSGTASTKAGSVVPSLSPSSPSTIIAPPPSQDDVYPSDKQKGPKVKPDSGDGKRRGSGAGGVKTNTREGARING